MLKLFWKICNSISLKYICNKTRFILPLVCLEYVFGILLQLHIYF